MNTTPIDPRGPQFSAMLTSVVLLAALATAHTPLGLPLLAVQAALFGAAVALGVQRTPAAYLFRRVVRPRLGPPTAWEDPRPPRFAQGIGLAFVVVGLTGFLVGPLWLGYAATGMALAAALLNATLQICLGCQVYGVCKLPQTDHVINHINEDDTHQIATPITDKKEVTA